jgi:hypothetical protein
MRGLQALPSVDARFDFTFYTVDFPRVAVKAYCCAKPGSGFPIFAAACSVPLVCERAGIGVTKGEIKGRTEGAP